MSIDPPAAEELGDGGGDPEWQETQKKVDESARPNPDKRMSLFMKFSSKKNQMSCRFNRWCEDRTLLFLVAQCLRVPFMRAFCASVGEHELNR